MPDIALLLDARMASCQRFCCMHVIGSGYGNCPCSSSRHSMRMHHQGSINEEQVAMTSLVSATCLCRTLCRLPGRSFLTANFLLSGREVGSSAVVKYLGCQNDLKTCSVVTCGAFTVRVSCFGKVHDCWVYRVYRTSRRLSMFCVCLRYSNSAVRWCCGGWSS